MAKLAGCPFCGGSNVFQRDDDIHNIWIECDDCQIGTLGHDASHFGGDAVAACRAAQNAWDLRAITPVGEPVGYVYRLRYGPDRWSGQLMYSEAATFERLPADDVKEVVSLYASPPALEAIPPSPVRVSEEDQAFAEYEGVTAKELAETVARYGKALRAIVRAWQNATGGRGNAERDLGWTGSADNWGQIFAWYAGAALSLPAGETEGETR